MLAALLIILIVLWFVGVIKIPGVIVNDVVLFEFNGKSISLLDLLIFLIIIWLIQILPIPIRYIAGIVFFLWILSIFGIIAITWSSNVFLFIIIVGVFVAVFSKK